MRDLKTIVNEAILRIGLGELPTVVGNSSIDARQLLALANQEGRELAARHAWQTLTKETTFVTQAQNVQTDLPADFERLIEGTMYNRSRSYAVYGPMTPQMWQRYKAQVTAGVWSAFRIRQGQIIMEPVPSAGDSIYYEYVTTNWVGPVGAMNPTQKEFQLDSDVPFLKDEIITLGIVWRWQRMKGMDYAEAMRTYEMRVAHEQGEDGGMGAIDMTGVSYDGGVYDPYIPSSGWPQ